MTPPVTTSHPGRFARWGPWRLIPAEPRRLKLIFLHGFGSSPRELKPLGQRLYRSGFHVVAPLLPGHGERSVGMNSCGLEDWEEAVRLTFESLHQDGSPVAVVGFCLGGVLGLTTARELNPRALVCLSTPVTRLDETLFPAAENDLPSTESLQQDCQSGEARRWRRRGCHPVVTRHFLETYQEAIVKGAERATEVRCPTLVVGGGKSRVVRSEDGEKLHQLLPLEIEKDFHLAPQSGHAVPVDHGRREVYRRVDEFLLEIDSTDDSRF